MGQQGQQPAQRGGAPKPETPYILITTFHSADRLLGVQMGDELREQLRRLGYDPDRVSVRGAEQPARVYAENVSMYRRWPSA